MLSAAAWTPSECSATQTPESVTGSARYRALRPLHDSAPEDPPREPARAAVPCPATSVYSRTDGVVPWRACLDTVSTRHENVEVISSHCGLGFHPLSVTVMLDRLTQPEGRWRPYRGARLTTVPA